MEMHQIRYFLAVSRTLNFTRAAEVSHVAQPSLTRAIKLLEAELGADLFRRERNLTHLTDFGHRMLPLLQQCYDSALSAKKLASSFKSGTVANLTLALSHTVPITLLISPLTEIVRTFPAPRAATGPDLRQLFLGAEGTLGVVTEIALKIAPKADWQQGFAATLRSWDLVGRYVIPEVNGLLAAYRESREYVVTHRDSFEAAKKAVLSKVLQHEGAAKALEFERAAQVRDRIKNLRSREFGLK